MWKRLHYLGDGQLTFFRTRDGAEIDFVVEREGKLTPIEVKWTEHPGPMDARHLRRFIQENADRVTTAYIVCRCPTPQLIEDKVLALPWQRQGNLAIGQFPGSCYVAKTDFAE